MLFASMIKLRARAIMCGDWAGINLDNLLRLDSDTGELYSEHDGSGVGIKVSSWKEFYKDAVRGDEDDLVTLYLFSIHVDSAVPLPETTEGWIAYATELRRKALAIQKMNSLDLTYRPKRKKGKN